MSLLKIGVKRSDEDDLENTLNQRIKVAGTSDVNEPSKIHTTPPAKFLLATLFFYLFSLSVLIPVFPALIELSIPTFLSEDKAEVETTARYGDLQVLKSVLDLVSLPILGGLSDFLGRKRVMVFCLMLLFLQSLLIWPSKLFTFEIDEERSQAEADRYYFMLKVTRVLSGLSDGVIPLVFASLTDLTKGNALLLPIYYGKVGLVLGLAFVCGPVTGAILSSKFTLAAAVMVCGLSAVISLLIYATSCKDTLPVSKRSPVPPRWWVDVRFLAQMTPLAQVKFFLTSPLLRAYTCVYFFHEVADAVYMTWIIYFDWRYGWSFVKIGAYISVVGVVVGLFQGFVLKYVTAKSRSIWEDSYEKKIMVWSLLSAALHFFLVGFVGGDGKLLFPLLILSGFSAFCLPVLRGVVLRTQKSGDFGSVNALFSMVGVLSRVAGNFIFPRVLKESEEGTGFGAALGDGAVNFMASAIMGVAVVVCVWATNRFNPADTGGVDDSDLTLTEGDDTNKSMRSLNGLVGLGVRSGPGGVGDAKL